MKPPSMLNKVNLENLYQHVLKLEGVRHPIHSFDQLEQARQYILKKFQEYGLQTREQVLKLEPFTQDFANIEAYFHNNDQNDLQSVLITGHYDTVINCPGAIDNASAIAVMLECARILAESQEYPNIRFIAFTLEEFNPAWVNSRNEKMKQLKLMDEKNRYNSQHISEHMRHYKKFTWRYRQQGLSPADAIKLYLQNFQDELSNTLIQFILFDYSLNKDFTQSTIWGSSVLYGSEAYVSAMNLEKEKIIGVINLDAIGFRSLNQSPHSPINKVDPKSVKSNSEIPNNKDNPRILIIANNESKLLMEKYYQSCKDFQLNLEPMKICPPYTFDEIAKNHLDLLRSDHTSFWKRNIPAIFVTDFSETPNPYYHTPADTIDKIDFNILAEITRATLATISKLSNLEEN